MTATKPIGQRFSHVYLERSQNLSDSLKARKRAAALWDALYSWDSINAEDSLKLELGCGHIRSVSFFLEKCRLDEFMDAITILYKRIRATSRDGKEKMWRTGLIRIFSEEGVGYTIDDMCGVHYKIDEEFERNRISTISNLNLPRYQAVDTAFQNVEAALGNTAPNGKMAIRHTFEAAEILFRLICPRAPRLGSAEINTHLKPLVETLYSGDQTACRAATKLLASFSDWVDGAHFYRHGQGTEEPTQAPLEIAVLAISMGASFIRWLAEIDQALLKKQTTGA